MSKHSFLFVLSLIVYNTKSALAIFTTSNYIEQREKFYLWNPKWRNIMMIQKAFWDHTFSERNVYKWHKQFREDPKSFEDKERSGDCFERHFEPESLGLYLLEKRRRFFGTYRQKNDAYSCGSEPCDFWRPVKFKRCSSRRDKTWILKGDFSCCFEDWNTFENTLVELYCDWRGQLQRRRYRFGKINKYILK